MRKSILAVSAALAACLLTAPLASASPSVGEPKRACADVVDGRAVYQSTTTGAEVLAQMDLGANACSDVSYRMRVLASDTDSTVIARASGVPVAATQDTPARVQYQTAVPFPDYDETVCVIITTRGPKGHVLDRAPDLNCVPLLLDSDISGSQKFH